MTSEMNEQTSTKRMDTPRPFQRDVLCDATAAAFKQGKRMVAPLMGFPGVELIGSTIKTAQQNYGEHYKAIKSLAMRFHPDVIFPLMDLSVEANAIGRYTIFPKDDSATVPKDTFHLEDLERYREINISFDSRVNCYVDTMKLMHIGLPKDILKGAYVTGPFSLAGLIMGADEAVLGTMTQPDIVTSVCEFATECIEEYTRLLIGAGAQVVCILEPSAVMLGPDQFEEFSAQYVRHITMSCKYSGIGTVYHTCGNTMHVLNKMVGAGVSGVSLDSHEAGVHQRGRRTPVSPPAGDLTQTAVGDGGRSRLFPCDHRRGRWEAGA